MTPQIKIKNKILDQEFIMKKSMVSNVSSVIASQEEAEDANEEVKRNNDLGEIEEAAEEGINE
jgi:hypothetical protein